MQVLGSMMLTLADTIFYLQLDGGKSNRVIMIIYSFLSLLHCKLQF